MRLPHQRAATLNCGAGFGEVGGSCCLTWLSFPAGSIPLTKIKSMRESLREKDLLKDYLQRHPHSRAHKLLRKPGATFEPMRNYLDVSVLGCRPQPSPVLAEHGGRPGEGARMWGGGQDSCSQLGSRLPPPLSSWRGSR